MGKQLMYFGAMLLIIGAVMHFGGKFLPLGHLPGDFKWTGSSGSVYFPMGSCIVISIVLSIIANLFFADKCFGRKDIYFVSLNIF